MMDYSHYSQRLVAAMLLLTPQITHATFSIVATDRQSRQVGGAGASCNPSGDIFSGLYLSAPNRSVLHTQALLLERNNPIVVTAREMMRRDESIQDILSTMEDMDSSNFTLSVGSFPSAELRQYGMADFFTNGGYTGQSLETAYRLAGMADGTEQIDLGSEKLVDDRYSYHAMGNVVADGTVDALQTGFLKDIDSDDHCMMARRLMAAMDSVLQDGFGDMRCINDHGGISATGAYLHIDNPDGKVLVHINKAGDGSYEPIEELKREFLQWQENNGCNGNPTGQVPDILPNSNIGIEKATTAAEVQPTVDNSASSSGNETNRLTDGLISIGLASSILLAAVVVAFWKVRSYQKQTTPGSVSIIQVEQQEWDA